MIHVGDPTMEHIHLMEQHSDNPLCETTTDYQYVFLNKDIQGEDLCPTWVASVAPKWRLH